MEDYPSIILALPGNEQLAAGLAEHLRAEVGRMTVRRFPDGESYVRIETPVDGRNVVLACSLHDPDAKVPALLFAMSTARELGAAEVGMVAPYLAYMRQDKRFNEGESITSVHFANLISRYVDWLVAVDPHLHRRTSLEDIYCIQSAVVHTAPLLAQWIRANVDSPILIGPDSESEQLVTEVARGATAPWLVLEKIRRGDREVSVSIPDPVALRGHTPVIVDDIISTARTMMAAVRHLAGHGIAAPVCVGVHAVFAGTAYADLAATGVARIVTCNTIAHESNAIDVSGPLAEAVRNLLASRRAVPASGSGP